MLESIVKINFSIKERGDTLETKKKKKKKKKNLANVADC